MLSLAELEEWLEEQWPSNLSELPHKITETVCSYTEVLYEQLNKYGPPAIPALQQKLEEHLPNFRPAPPPPPPPPTRWQRISGWASSNRYAIVGAVTVSAVGIGLAYHRYPQQVRRLLRLGDKRSTRRLARTRNGTRREAVVVLGADTPIGRALTMSLASQDLIVIAAVINPASLRTFDQQLLPSNRGFVAVRHLDTGSIEESASTFAADVRSMLALRFPLTAAGDPFARPGDNATLIGIVNALSYVPPTAVPDSLRSGAQDMSRAMQQHVIGPLSAISALLPELRIAHKRMYSANPECSAPVTIVTLVCGADRESTAVQHLLTDAATTGADGLRGEMLSLRDAQQRPLRMTVLTVTPPDPSILPGGAAHTRPTVSRAPSNNWQIRDRHTMQLQDKVADLILASDTRRVLQRRQRVTPLLEVYTARVLAVIDRVLYRSPLAKYIARWQRPRRAVTPPSSTSQSQQMVRSTPSLGTADTASGANAQQQPRQDRPYTHSSGAGSQLDLETPSNLDTGSSGGESGNEEAFVLRSAPSSADGEEDHRWRQGSPWLGQHQREGSADLTQSQISSGRASGNDSPMLGASWVRLGESQQQ